MLKIANHLFRTAFVILFAGAGCVSTPSEVAIRIDGAVSGAKGNEALQMLHGRNLSESPSLLVSTGPLNVGRVQELKLELSRSGVESSTGYEFLAIMNDVDIRGGGGLFRGALAGDDSLYSLNTGTIAKTSYYHFKDSGGEASLSLPNAEGAHLSRLILARVTRSNNLIARIPFSQEGPASENFFSTDCLAGNNPCFDMSTLIETLFSSVKEGVERVVNANSSLTLGGDDGAGDFRIDYIPTIEVRRACGSETDPGFGFVVSAVIDAALGTKIRLKLPFIFSLEANRFTIFTARVHPQEDLGGCQEDQFIKAITVRAETVFGLGAQALADFARKQIVCSLFPTIESMDCSGIEPSPIGGGVVLALEAMVEKTAVFYWQQARGDAFVPSQYGLLLLPSSAHERVTSTNVTPGSANAVQLELQFTE